MKSGDARVALIGFPSVGKSTLLTKVTKSESAIAAYEFTTLTCVPGKIEYRGASIQLLDLPGIIEGAAQGRGRGKQAIAVARTADLVVMLLDATKSDVQKELLEKELEQVGIRLNRKRPNVYFKLKTGGGIGFNATCKLTHMNEKLAYHILHEYKYHNAEILIREDVTVDEFIDVIVGNRKYLRCLYVYNKIDALIIEEVDKLARRPDSLVISCEQDLNLDYFVEQIWEYLGLLRIYTKKRGELPDLENGLIVRAGSTLEHVCHLVHRDLAGQFKYSLVWGCSAKHQPQKVGLTHRVQDEDIVQIVKKK